MLGWMLWMRGEVACLRCLHCLVLRLSRRDLLLRRRKLLLSRPNSSRQHKVRRALRRETEVVQVLVGNRALGLETAILGLARRCIADTAIPMVLELRLLRLP